MKGAGEARRKFIKRPIWALLKFFGLLKNSKILKIEVIFECSLKFQTTEVGERTADISDYFCVFLFVCNPNRDLNS